MANLVDQINEMIDILQVVNPAAAAQFRGGDSRSPAPMQPAPIQPAPVVARTKASVQSRIIQATEVIYNPSVAPTIKTKAPTIKTSPPSSQMQPFGLHQLNLNLTAGKMIEGIVLAEILGKPISRRRNHRQF